MAQLLIELFSEEIPARMQLGAARDFERLFGDKLKTSGLTFESMKAYVGPRRLALVVEGLPAEQAAVTEEVKGPKDGAPEQAMAGFLRKVGLSQDQLVLENGVWLARIEKPGRKTADVLGAMLGDVILAFPWPKSMRSGTSTFRWVRPLKRILFLFDGAVIPFELEGLTASNLTEGHRFLGSGEPVAVSDFFTYDKALADNFVILDHKTRQDIILIEARAACAAAGCELIEDQGLLEEVAGLNEYPVPLLGDMDPAFLTLPPEVIKTSMRTHQKYFAVRGSDGKMAAKFVITANMKASDGGTEIKRGNAKVLSARLSDGVFFWKEDNRAGNFDQWLKKLEGVTFHAKLGTMAQRVARIEAMARYIAPLMGADADVAGEAARLAKADLASYMVGEFPELQGVMGGYYADAAQKPADIANAIREHYKPQGPSDSVPASKVSAAVALADKIDTLVGFFAIDEKPTGSKDPYALRRSALGILRILREHRLRVSIRSLIRNWYVTLGTFASGNNALAVIEEGMVYGFGSGQKNPDSPIDISSKVTDWLHRSEVLVVGHDLPIGDFYYPTGLPVHGKLLLRFRSCEAVDIEVPDFFLDRLKVQLREEGRPLEAIEAVLALKDDDIVRMTDKLAALVEAVQSPFGDDLLAVHKRASNILAAAKITLPDSAPRLMADAPELEATLLNHLKTTKSAVASAVTKENWFEALRLIAAMRHDVDAFLDGVLVNADDADTRANRLLILAGICQLSDGIADLGKIA